MGKIVVITGAGAGVGRATATEFAAHGYDVALLGRDAARLERAATELREQFGVRALAIPTDVADAEAVDRAADTAEAELGPIDVWVNVAMATVFAPVADVTPAELQRDTAVTYFGQVYGVKAALRHMRPRNRGTIVCVGSALAYRAIPLQSVYCAAKFAVRGFVDSLRSELLHDKVDIALTMVHLPAINTPQFDWALNKMGRKPMPVPPIFQPEMPARAIRYAAEHPRREFWVGWPTIRAIIGNKIAPGLIDRYLARTGYSGQLTDETVPADAPSNLFEPVPGPYGAHGRFDRIARPRSWAWFTSTHRAVVAGALGLTLVAGLAALADRAFSLGDED